MQLLLGILVGTQRTLPTTPRGVWSPKTLCYLCFERTTAGIRRFTTIRRSRPHVNPRTYRISLKMMTLKKRLRSAARAGLEFANTYAPESRKALSIARLESSAVPRYVEPAVSHVDAAIRWIKRAQDSTGNGGVAWGYRARRPVRTNQQIGWVSAYPETTGYIVPTMLRYADFRDDADCLERARRMVDWEVSIQLPDGGFQGGTYGSQPVASSTFVTGQVLFGLVAGYQRFGDEWMRTAAIRAGDWLVSCLDDTGRFVRGHSLFAAPGAKVYEVRTGLAMAELGDLVGDDKCRTAAASMADYALRMQQSNGWFAENDLDSNDQPLTHTIGYALEGLHGLGLRLGCQAYIDAAVRTLQAITSIIRPDGFLPGRLRNDWTAAVDWACLTGSAQIGGVFIRMYSQTGDPSFLEAGKKLLGFVCFTQDLADGIEGLEGAIRGSYPFSGKYGQWCALNWAAKFFSDSVMDYLPVNEASNRR